MKITISIAQIRVKQADPEENLRKAERLIAEASRRNSDIICFPEMWTTGFNWEYNEKMARDHEKIIDRIALLAMRYKIWINGSTLAINEESKPSNTSILFDPKGNRVGIYRKIHLFSVIGEEKHVAPGKSLCMIDAPWGLSALTICYDIRFPELFRAYAMKGAKIVFSSMAFPYPKLEHWKVLVRARAIENQMYVIGTNQVGSEDLGPGGRMTYCGDSVIIDPWGKTVIEASEDEEELLTADIDMDRVDDVRSSMKVLKDRRPELYG
ncbi:MAG: carbon-nitrogen family hydrolase [Candidatus Omnitrophota bacterium]|jgi:predicted amidohydrolase